MWDLLALVLDELHIGSQLTEETRDAVKSVRGKYQNANILLEKIGSEKSVASCIKCDNRPFRSLFLACLYYELNDFSKAQFHARRATRDFELHNLAWNANLANWVYGEIYMLSGRKMPGRRELIKTIKVFNAMGKEFRWQEKYEARNQCTEFASKIEKRLKNLDKNWDGTAYYEKKRDKPSLSISSQKSPPSRVRNPYTWKRSQIIFPVQSQIRAGTEGNFIFESESDLDAILDELDFDKKKHYFYNLREEGNPIYLKARTYRWFRVEGNSMNQAEPVAIMNGDYVLAIDLNLSNMDVRIGDIVIANLNNPSQDERAGVIKKYSHKGLESQSSDDYQIISMEDANISGLAIAVAKPV